MVFLLRGSKEGSICFVNSNMCGQREICSFHINGFFKGSNKMCAVSCYINVSRIGAFFVILFLLLICVRVSVSSGTTIIRVKHAPRKKSCF